MNLVLVTSSNFECGYLEFLIQNHFFIDFKKKWSLLVYHFHSRTLLSYLSWGMILVQGFTSSCNLFRFGDTLSLVNDISFLSIGYFYSLLIISILFIAQLSNKFSIPFSITFSLLSYRFHSSIIFSFYTLLTTFF